MITVRREVRTDRDVAVVAAYLTDFTTTQDWDPHTVRCERIVGVGPPAVGQVYENVQAVLFRRTTLRYAVTQLEPGRRIRLEGSGGSLEATDAMTFEAAPAGTGTGTVVVYGATFTFGGVAGRFEPLLRPLMNRIADQGAQGMKTALDKL